MSQTPDAERSPAEKKHPEIFDDPDAGQVFPDDRRPPESEVMSGLKKGCLWAVGFVAIFLLIIALTWKLAWDVAPWDVLDPTRPARPRPEAVPAAPTDRTGDREIGAELGEGR